MLKVSLLPDGYRHHLESKKKKELVSKIALIVLVCLFIVYGGVAIKGQILKSKYEVIQEKNASLKAEFPELEEYQVIYNDLLDAKKKVDSITPQDPEAVEFFTIISNQTPDYVKISEVDLENWYTAGICNITCTVQDYSDVQDYKALFETEEMKEFVKLVQISSIQRTVQNDGKKSVTFTLSLSMSNAVVVPTAAPQYVVVTDSKGETVTEDGGAAKTEVATTASSSDTTTTKKGD